MFLRKIVLHYIKADTLEKAQGMTEEDRKFGRLLTEEGIKGWHHIGAFPLVHMSVFFVPLDEFEKAPRKLKQKSSFKVINIQKPQIQTIFEQFKNRETQVFLVIYGENFEKFKARTTLAARVYHLQEGKRERQEMAG